MNESEQQEIEKIKKECLTYFHQSPVWKKVLKGFRDCLLYTSDAADE